MLQIGQLLLRVYSGDEWIAYWEISGGFRTTTSPAIASWGPGRLDVFSRGENNALWHKWFANGAWHAWESLGGFVTAGPAAVSWGTGRIDAFARGTDGAFWHRWFDGAWEP